MTSSYMCSAARGGKDANDNIAIRSEMTKKLPYIAAIMGLYVTSYIGHLLPLLRQWLQERKRWRTRMKKIRHTNNNGLQLIDRTLI